MRFKSFGVVLPIFIISKVFGFDQTYFTQSNIASINHNGVHTNFTTKSSISCLVACKTFAQTCTHAVIKHLDNKFVQCSLIDVGNGTIELFTVGDGSKVWTKGNGSLSGEGRYRLG